MELMLVSSLIFASNESRSGSRAPELTHLHPCFGFLGPKIKLVVSQTCSVVVKRGMAFWWFALKNPQDLKEYKFSRFLFGMHET